MCVCVCVCVCVRAFGGQEKEREFVCLCVFACLFVYPFEYMCVCVFSSPLLLICLSLCLAPLSLSIVSILLLSPDHLSINLLSRYLLLPPDPATLFSVSKAPTYLGLSLLLAPCLFLALSYRLVSEASFFISFVLLCLSTFPFSTLDLLLYQATLSPASPVSASDTLSLHSGISWSQLPLSLSVLHIRGSIPCLCNSFLASNLFMFSLALQ